MLVPGALELDLGPVFEAYDRDGYARLGRVLDDEGIALLRARADAIMLGEVVYEGLFFQRDARTGRYEDLEYKKGWQGPGLDYRKIEKLEKDPLFLAWMRNPLFERVARARIDGAIAIYRATMFSKAARGGSVLPWHQDGGTYWGLDREPTLQIWTALDDATEASGAVEVLPGSHAAGLATPLGGVIPRDVLERERVDERRIKVPAKAGEAMLIHNHLWHGSGVNTTDAPRRALTICFMSAATRCLRKRRAPRTFFRLFD